MKNILLLTLGSVIALSVNAETASDIPYNALIFNKNSMYANTIKDAPIQYTYTQTYTAGLPKGLPKAPAGENVLMLPGPSFPISKTTPLPVYGDPRSYGINPLTNPYAMPNNPLYPTK